MKRRAHVITDHKTELFAAGLDAAGYEVTKTGIENPGPNDAVIAWNRKPSNESRIEFYERAGSKVFIAENGYIGTDDDGGRLISLALNYHQGKGRWYVGEEKRYLKQNFKILPWREGGKQIIILAQRGIGDSKTHEWALEIQQQIMRQTKRPVIVRQHPGKEPIPLEPAIDKAHAVVTWSSAAAIKAIAYGVPAFYFMTQWIGADAARFEAWDLENPYKGDRAAMFHRLGWAQWTQKEVASGVAFRGLEKL